MTFFDEHIRCIRPRGRRSSWLSEERRVKRVSRKRRMLRRRGSRVRFVRSLHGAFRISISGALALNRALLPSASYPFVPFIQRPSVSRRLFPTSSFSVGPAILALLASDLPSVSLVRAQIAALRRDILSVLFWRTSGGWHADKGNLLAQEILSQEARGWLAHAVRLIYLLLVSDVECL